MQRLGFFGGCFNPPTIAHYKLALEALKVANLDKIYFVPMGDHYKKEGLALAENRYEMLEAMLKEDPRLEISRIQMDENKELHAVDTFRLINEKFKSSENYFIMGSDNFEKIHNWKGAEELLTSYKYIILSRGNFENKNYIIVNSTDDLKEISSSLVRKNIAKDKSIKNLVTEDVESYIIEKGLYK